MANPPPETSESLNLITRGFSEFARVFQHARRDVARRHLPALLRQIKRGVPATGRQPSSARPPAGTGTAVNCRGHDLRVSAKMCDFP